MRRHTNIEVLLLGGLCLSGTAALIYEVAWTRALTLVMGSSTYALSTMLASFMSGLALGGYLGGILADRTERPAFSFALIEAGIAVFGLVTLLVINNLSPLYAWVYYTFHLSFFSFSLAQFVLSFLIMLVPTTLMGATLPVVLKARAKDLAALGRESGDVYSINNVGAIFGSFGAGFILIPALGVTAATVIAAIINMVVAVIIVSFTLRASRTLQVSLVLLSIITILSTIYYPRNNRIFNYYIAEIYPSYDIFKKVNSFNEILFQKDGLEGLIQVVRTNETNVILVNHGKTEGSAIRLKNQIVESSAASDWANQVLLAYLPLQANPDARSFLNIGLGTGTTLRAARTSTRLKDIDCVEINPVVLEAVKEHFYPELFSDPRITFITADARNYLSLVPKKYDIISSEPSYPVDLGISHLFTSEFFELVKARLAEQGVFAQWLPGYLFKDMGKKLMIRTFGAVFPYTYVWHILASNDIIFLGSMRELDIDGDFFKAIEGREKAKGISRSYRLWLNPYDVRKIVDDGGDINTDDLPLLEFIAARSFIK